MAKWYEGQMRIIHPSLGAMPGEVEQIDMAAFARSLALGHYNAQHLEYSQIWDGEQRLFLFQTDQAARVSRDVLAEYLPEAHRQGLKVFIYMNVHWAGKRFIAEHPDWVQRRTDGSPLTGVYGGAGTSCCVNSPWRDWIFGLIHDMGARYEIDGIFFDGPCFYQGTCYCDSCQARFRDSYGLALTDIVGAASPHWPEFVEFRYDSIAGFLRDGNTALKVHLPAAPLYMNANGLHSGAMNGRNNRRLMSHQDILGAEGGFIFYGRPIDVPLWKVSATAKFLEAQAGGKPTVIFTAAGHKPWEYPLTPPEIRLNTAATFACGASPWLGCYYKDIHDPSVQAVSDELAFFAQHEGELAHTVGLAETALMWSTATADYYGTHLPEIDFMVDKPQAAQEFDFQGSFSGAYEALVRSGTPFQVIDEDGIESGGLAGLRNLVIADAACMSQRTADAIREFVRQGGTLIATNQTSLYDERGYPRNDFALAEALGASYAGPRALSTWDLIWLETDLRAQARSDRDEIPSPRYQVRVKSLSGARPVAWYYEPTESRYSPKPALSVDPAAIANHFGNGTCLYLAGNWARSYWSYRVTEYQAVLACTARQEPLALLEAPSSAVEITIRRQVQSGEWQVHLLNYTGEMERPIKRIIPLQDLTLKLRTASDPARVTALRAGLDLPFRREGAYAVIQLGHLGHHELIRVRW